MITCCRYSYSFVVNSYKKVIQTWNRVRSAFTYRYFGSYDGFVYGRECVATFSLGTVSMDVYPNELFADEYFANSQQTGWLHYMQNVLYLDLV